MELVILIPLHHAQYKAIQNIHMGRDVRTEIPEDERETFLGLTRNYGVIYEYLVNKHPDRIKDGQTVVFEERKSVRDTVGTGNILGTLSKITTNYLGAKARVENVIPKMEDLPKPAPLEPRVEISETGAVVGIPLAVGAGAPKVIELVVPAVKTDTGAVSAEPYMAIQAPPLWRGEKIVLYIKPRTGEFADYYNITLGREWDYALAKEFGTLRYSYMAGGNIVGDSGFQLGHKVWGVMYDEIVAFKDTLKAYYMTNIDPKQGADTPREERIALKKNYREYIGPVITKFKEYLMSKYTVVVGAKSSGSAAAGAGGGGSIRSFMEAAAVAQAEAYAKIPESQKEFEKAVLLAKIYLGYDPSDKSVEPPIKAIYTSLDGQSKEKWWLPFKNTDGDTYTINLIDMENKPNKQTEIEEEMWLVEKVVGEDGKVYFVEILR